MKLGTQTGSLTNHLYARMTTGAPEPAVDMDATILAWTDRYAGTVTGIGRIIYVRADKVVASGRKLGIGHQDWTCTPDPAGTLYTFRRNRHGGWDEVRLNGATGRWVLTRGYGLILGRKDHHHDWTF